MPVLWELYITFFKIGAFSFGGGYAMIPLMQKEVVSAHRWLTIHQVTDVIAISQMTPGPIAINLATFVGFRVAGVVGAVAATLGVITPSMILIVVLAGLFLRFQQLTIVQAILKGIRPVVVGLITLAGVLMFRASVVNWLGWVILLAALGGTIFFKLHPIWLIAIAGVIGLVWM